MTNNWGNHFIFYQWLDDIVKYVVVKHLNNGLPTHQ